MAYRATFVSIVDQGVDRETAELLARESAAKVRRETDRIDTISFDRLAEHPGDGDEELAWFTITLKPGVANYEADALRWWIESITLQPGLGKMAGWSRWQNVIGDANEPLPYRSSARYVVVTAVALVAIDDNQNIGATETPEQAAKRIVTGRLYGDDMIDAISVPSTRYVFHSGERSEIFEEQVARVRSTHGLTSRMMAGTT